MTDKKFRISSKRLFLTYSQVPPEITHQEILNQFNENPYLFPFSYIISKEVHEDGSIHYHAVLIHKQDRFDIKNSKALDLNFNHQQFHGNYQPVRNLPRVVDYVCKDKDYITDLKNIQDGELLSAKEFLIKEVEAKGIEKALIEHYETNPNQALAGISVSALQKQFNAIQQMKLKLELDEIKTPFSLDNFRVSPQLNKWMHNPNKTLLLVGPSGIGKTAFCQAYAKHHNLKTLLVSHKEDLQRLDSSYQAIIIDDANLHEMESTQLLSLIETQQEKTLRVLYKHVLKKPHLVQMMTMNMKEYVKNYHEFSNERLARRMVIEQPEKPFMVNVNIQVNNITNNNFNYNSDSKPSLQAHTFEQHQKDEIEHIAYTQKKAADIYYRRNT